MSIFLPLTPLKTIFLSEFILVFAMAMRVIPQEFSYLVLLLLIASFVKLNKLDALKLFIISIPLFVALPANVLSDSMSIWRFLIFALIIKVCHSELVSESTGNKDLSYFQLIKQSIKKIGGNNSNIQKILKQVQNDRMNRLLFLTILFFIIATLSLISAQDIGVGVKKMLFLSNILLLFPVVILTIKTKNDFREIIKFIFYSTGLLVSIGYLQFILTFFIPLFKFWHFWAQNIIVAFYGQNLSHLLSYSNTWFSYYEILPATLRMFSTMPDSHSFAMLIVISIPALLALIYLKSGAHSLECNRPKFIYRLKPELHIFALIIFLLAIFFSGSRGIWVGSIFALLAGIYLFVNSQNREFKNHFCKLNLRARFFSCPCFKLLIEKTKIKNLINQIKLLKNSNNYSDDYLSKLLISSLLLFFILMPVSSLILRINQEVQLYQSNTQLSDEEKEELNIFERAISISDFSETSNMGRFQIWNETLMSVKDNLFLGVGFGNFPLILDESIANSKKGASAHNIYLDILSEIGIIGLAIFLFILIEILKTSYNLFFKLKTGYLKIFAGSFFVYFVWICAYGLFDVVIFNDKVLMMVVVMTGVLYSLNCHCEKPE
ncbi:MAG: O-antigen ligase family protein [Candidatus Pacebacteria bacterium]|nr:O-antigen ligase family protein [Candidatus Paceibacterota bacterium]